MHFVSFWNLQLEKPPGKIMENSSKKFDESEEFGIMQEMCEYNIYASHVSDQNTVVKCL